MQSTVCKNVRANLFDNSNLREAEYYDLSNSVFFAILIATSPLLRYQIWELHLVCMMTRLLNHKSYLIVAALVVF